MFGACWILLLAWFLYAQSFKKIFLVSFQNWYRGEIESVDLDHHTARVLYIDFGNEESVKFDQIHPLSANIDAAPPCVRFSDCHGFTDLLYDNCHCSSCCNG